MAAETGDRTKLKARAFTVGLIPANAQTAKEAVEMFIFAQKGLRL